MTATTATADEKPVPRKRGRPPGPRRTGPALNVSQRAQQARQSAVAGGVQLSWRLQEFAAAIGVSMPTIWRRVQAGDIRVVKIGGVTLVPRSEAVRLGLIDT